MTPPRNDAYAGVLAISLMAMVLNMVLLVLGLIETALVKPRNLPADHTVVSTRS